MSPRGKWYYKSNTSWHRFSVPYNENIIEEAYEKFLKNMNKNKVRYAYPLESKTLYEVTFSLDGTHVNKDMQSGEITYLKRSVSK